MIRFAAFPISDPPPAWEAQIIDIFRRHEDELSSDLHDKGLTSEEVLAVLAEDLKGAGFLIEKHELSGTQVARSPFFGEENSSAVRYRFDVYHPQWLCCLAIEAGRSWTAIATHRDLVEPLLVVDVDSLCLAVPNLRGGPSGDQRPPSHDFDGACNLAATVYGHTRLGLPKRLFLIGY
jgi:hypothetical protein